MKTFNLLCLLIIIGFGAVFIFCKAKGRTLPKGPEVSTYTYPKEKGIYVLLLYGILAVRFIGLGSIPGGFNQDGAMGAVDALALATYGTDRFGVHLPAHFEGWGYGQMSVLLSYLTVPFIQWFGLSEVTARIPMMIVSLLGMAAVYGITKEWFSPKSAWIALFFTAINPWHFMQSRWALDCNVFPHMFIIGCYFLAKGLSKHRNYYIAMIFYALCMYAYGVSFYMVPFFLLFTCILLLCCKKINWKQTGICLLVYFGLAFPIYGTMLINFMRWDTVKLPFVTMSYFENSVRAGDMLFFSEEPLKQLLANFRSLVNVVFLQKPDLIWNAIDDFGTVYRCSMPFVLLGVGICIYLAVKGKEKKTQIGSRILLIYWGCSIFTGLCINAVNVNRINIIFYSHIIFAAIAIYYLIRKWKVFAAVVLVIYMLQSTLFVNRYYTTWAEQMEEVFYKDFLDAVAFAGEQNCDTYYITPDTQYTGAYKVSEILTQFTLRMDAAYTQGKTDIFGTVENAYTNRFRYVNPTAEEIRTDTKTAYVIRTGELYRYDFHLFAVKYFGEYCVVMPGQFANW